MPPYRRRSQAVTALVLASALAIALPQMGTAAENTATGFRADAQVQLDLAERHLTALAKAIPADKFTWRPGQGVRSTAEVFLHVASGNYFLASIWGAKIPADVDLKNLEASTTDKDQVIAKMTASFAYIRNAIAAMPDSDLERKVNFFGRQATTREIILRTAVHAHEHLGQSIAYARDNGIVPPWSVPEPKDKPAHP
jgi:uncharacterized damage-inducible protein DinB